LSEWDRNVPPFFQIDLDVEHLNQVIDFFIIYAIIILSGEGSKSSDGEYLLLPEKNT
jgi:hypothetical protein